MSRSEHITYSLFCDAGRIEFDRFSVYGPNRRLSIAWVVVEGVPDADKLEMIEAVCEIAHDGL